jgi:hypothetical protein
MNSAFDAGKVAGVQGFARKLKGMPVGDLSSMARRVRTRLAVKTPSAAMFPKHSPGYPAYAAIKREFARRR